MVIKTYSAPAQNKFSPSAIQIPLNRYHNLKGNWNGYSAASFGHSYGAIYVVHKHETGYIIEVTRVSKHDYKKR